MSQEVHRGQSIENIKSSRGKAFILPFFRVHVQEQGKITASSAEVGKENPHEMRVSLEQRRKGEKIRERASTDSARILTMTFGSARIKLMRQGEKTDVRDLPRYSQVFIGKGVAYELDIREDGSEIITTVAPGHGDSSPLGMNVAYVVESMNERARGKDAGEADPNYAPGRGGWIIGHFLHDGNGESLTTALESKFMISKAAIRETDRLKRGPDGDLTFVEKHAESTLRKELVPPADGTSMSFILEGEYTLTLEVEPGQEITRVVKPGSIIFWDNKIPHRWEATPGSVQVFFRTPSVPPTVTPTFIAERAERK